MHFLSPPIRVITRAPSQNASPELRRSMHENIVLFLSQTTPWFILWNNVCDFGICSFIFNHRSNGCRSKGSCSHLLCGTGGTEQASASEMGWQRQHVCYTYKGLQKEQPPTHTSHNSIPNSGRCIHILCTPLGSSNGHLREQNLWRERTEQGSSCSGQHGAFCSMWFPAGNLCGCCSSGKWEISPSPSIPLKKALVVATEAPKWSRHEENGNADVRESSACLEGKLDMFLKWSLIWHSHPEEQI